MKHMTTEKKARALLRRFVRESEPSPDRDHANCWCCMADFTEGYPIHVKGCLVAQAKAFLKERRRQ